MIRKMPKWMAGMALVLAVGASPLACGGGGDDEDMGGAPNDEDGTGGNETDGSGGNETDGSGGNETDGSGGNGEAGAPGTGGTAPTEASIDDLIGAICAYEYRCCDGGEVAYRLGTAAGNSEEDCVEYFTFQLHESNNTDNPFPTGSAQDLLGVLAYTVNLTRVSENAAGIGECIAEYEARDCPTLGDGTTAYCVEPEDAPDEAACALVNLFDPALEEGDRCTYALSQENVGTNDVECAAGTTCLEAGGDNPEDFPICVQRGEGTDPCTEDDDCDYNFYCAPNSDCTEKGDLGDDCTFNDEDDPMPGDEDAGCKAGLSCDPVDLVCVNTCTENFPCLSNAACPEGFVCAPINVDEDDENWSACVPTGTDAGDRCDEDADCVEGWFCDGSVCDEDDADATCDRNAQCPTGRYCNLNTFDSTNTAITAAATCDTFIQGGDPCSPPSATTGVVTGCGEDAPLCLWDSADATWKCQAELRGAGDDCFDLGAGLPSECEPGLRCELTTDGEPYTCTAGADLGDACDATHTDADEIDCGVGLTCKNEECVEQVGPGSDCEDPDNEGAADSTMCTNASCTDNWDENGPEFICTDAPVPESNGGDGLICGVSE